MPTYIFHNKETDEYWEELCSISAMMEFLKENPHIKQVPQAPMIVTGVNIKNKLDGGWNETLSRVAESNPYSPLAEKHGATDSKSVVRRNLVNKHFRGKK